MSDPYELALDGDILEERGDGWLARAMRTCMSEVVRGQWKYAKYNHDGVVVILTEDRARFARDYYKVKIPSRLEGQKILVESLLRVTPTPLADCLGNKFQHRLVRHMGLLWEQRAAIAYKALSRIGALYGVSKLPAHFLDWFMGAGAAGRFASQWGAEVCSSMVAQCYWEATAYRFPDVDNGGVFEPLAVTPKDISDAVEAGEPWAVVWESEAKG